MTATKQFRPTDVSVVNVKDKGAKGDYATDDSAAIQAAIDTLPTSVGDGARTGGIVLFPRGVYTCLSTLNVPRTIRLVGVGGLGSYESGVDGVGSCLRAGTTGMTLVKVNGSATLWQQGVSFEHLHFHGKNDSGTETLVEIDNANRCHFVACAFGGAGVGVYMHHAANTGSGDSSWHMISDCNFYSLTTGVKCGSSSDQTNGGGGIIRGGSFHTCTTGVYANGVSTPRISAAKFDQYSGTIGVESLGTATKISDCAFELTSATGIKLDGSGAGDSGYGATVSSCLFTGHGSTGTGIQITSNATKSEIIAPSFLGLETNVSDSGVNTSIIGETSAVKTKAGAPSDSDLLVPANGAMILDSTNHRLYVRDGGVWKYVSLT